MFDGGGEAADAFFEGGFVEDAVAEAHLGAAAGFEGACIEEFAGDVHDFVLFDGLLKKLGLEAGLDFVGEGHPDIESAVRTFPMDAGEVGEVGVDGGEHGVSLATVAMAKSGDVMLIVSSLHDAGEDGLSDVGGAEILIAFAITQGADEIAGEDTVAGAKAGREGF